MATNADQPRSGKGRFVRGIATAERDAQAARLRDEGKKFREIAAELGIDVKTAYDAVQRAIQASIIEDGTAARKHELQRLADADTRLDDLEMVVIAVLEARHVTVSQGRIVYEGETPLEDKAPVLMAVDRLLKIEDSRRRNGERRARLQGLDAETKVNVSGGVKYEIVGIDPTTLT